MVLVDTTMTQEKSFTFIIQQYPRPAEKTKNSTEAQNGIEKSPGFMPELFLNHSLSTEIHVGKILIAHKAHRSLIQDRCTRYLLFAVTIVRSFYA